MKEFRPRLPVSWAGYVEQMRDMTDAELSALFNPSLSNIAQSVTETEKGATFEYKGGEPITSEQQAIEFFQVDTNRLKVERVRFNSWGKEGDMKYQVRLETKRIDSVDWGAFKKEILTDIIQKRSGKGRGNAGKNGLVVECMITDLHIGKVGFDPHTLETNWTIQQSAAAYDAVIDDLIDRLKGEKVSKIILPTGNDLLNIDGSGNTTTRGTPQMTGQFWQQLFTFSARLVRHAINRLSEYAPVYVPVIPGNHDQDSCFALGEVLSAIFEDREDVQVDNRPIQKKHYLAGKTLIMWTHGNFIKVKDLHAAVSAYAPEAFAKSKYRYIHSGHYHKNLKEVIRQVSKDERHGIDVEICPTLSPADEWHYKNLYIGNMRRSKSFIYEPDRGLVGEVYFNL